MEAYHEVVQVLPQWLQPCLERVPPRIQAAVQEIRLHEGGEVLLVTNASVQTIVGQSPLTQRQLEEVLFSLCGGSLYAHEAEIAQGFLHVTGGHRVGIGGRYTKLENGQTVLQQVSSLNIRIARFPAKGLPAELWNLLKTPFSGLVIAGEPGSGKTTLLRNLVIQLSRQRCLYTVIDERGEIFPGGAQTAVQCDCIQGLNKIDAIEMALRTLGPRLLLIDELVSLEETRLLERGAHSGVQLILTMHASSRQQLEQKVQIQYLLERKILQHACILAGREHPGQIQEVYSY